MSVLFLPPSAGAASVPDATETVSGKIRIATSAEATTGTDDTTAITPLKLKSVVDAAVVGGVTYQGTFDASSPADLSNATKGDLYIISVAGTYQGQTWAVGDHLLINADMGGTLDPNKIDKVDNTDSVTSVAGRTGAVTLSTADISGLATVASTGAYSDLSGTPTLGTAAAEDVGTSAGNVVQLNGSAQLPAVDGSLLTGITATVAALNDVGDVSAAAPSDTNVLKYNSTSGDWESGAVAASEVSGLATVATTGAYSDLSGTPTNVSTFTNDAGYLTEAQTVVLQYNSTTTATAVSSKDLHVYRLYGAGGFTLTVSATAANGLVEINNISASACTISGPTFRRNGEGATGGVTSITVEAGERRLFYLESTSTWLEMNATLLDRLADVSISSPANGEALIYNSTSGDWENGTVSASVAALNDIGDVSAAAPSNTNVIKYNSTSGDWESGAVAYSEVTGTPTLGTAAAEDVGTSAGNVVQLNGSAQLPAVDGSLLTGITASVAALNDIGDVSAAAPNNGDVIAYNSTSGDWESSAPASAPVSSVAGKTGAVTLVIDDMTDVDTTTATPSAGDLLEWDGSNWVPVARFEVVTTITTSTNLTVPEHEQLVRTSGSGITLTLPNIASNSIAAGVRYQVKVTDSNSVTIAPNGTELLEGVNSSYATGGAKEALTILCDGSGWWFV